jgi:hypothetical protein
MIQHTDTNDTEPTTSAVRCHIFEKAGLGKAPYKFLRIENRSYQAAPGAPIQPGGSCRYCSTGIHFFYYLRSADGKTFYVGSDCILKSGDAGLRRIVKEEERRRRAEQNMLKRQVATEELDRYISTHADTLKARPHPNEFFAGRGKTLLDYATWMRDNSGLAGRRQVLRTLRELDAK